MELLVNTASSYPIFIKPDFGKLPRALELCAGGHSKTVVVTDSNVSCLYLKELLIAANLPQDTPVFVFEAGEKSKSIDTIQEMLAFFIAHKVERKSLVIALGGGVVGDMAGFAAAIYMRGIDFIQIPTTLLSQVDSSVGGKTGIDFLENKNILGAFHQPALVYINIATLHTLPPVQFASGMGEVIKHGLILDEDYYRFIRDSKEGIKAGQPQLLEELIYGSCRIKTQIVSQDEKETGIREILNFGHSFGHAIESELNFQLPHGHCVALGMAAALRLSNRYGYISQENVDEYIETIRFFGLSGTLSGLDIDRVLSRMELDKKNKGSQFNLILLKRIGVAYAAKNIPKEDIRWALAEIGKNKC